jgi:hypothetical protein
MIHLFSLAVLSTLNFSTSAMASSHWANCPTFETDTIQAELRKSSEEGSAGPEYHLKSGQVLENSGSVCKKGKGITAEDWKKELSAGLTSTSSVTQFQVMKSAEDLGGFLKQKGVEVEDPQALRAAVSSYLKGVGGHGEKVVNPAILVGTSGKESALVFAMSDGKYQSAAFITIRAGQENQKIEKFGIQTGRRIEMPDDGESIDTPQKAMDLYNKTTLENPDATVVTGPEKE